MKERYKITDQKKKIFHKIDMKGKPDFDGLAFKIIEEKNNGYIAIIVDENSSQPSSLVFVDKQFFKDRE